MTESFAQQEANLAADHGGVAMRADRLDCNRRRLREIAERHPEMLHKDWYGLPGNVRTGRAKAKRQLISRLPGGGA